MTGTLRVALVGGFRLWKMKLEPRVGGPQKIATRLFLVLLAKVFRSPVSLQDDFTHPQNFPLEIK